MDDFAVRSAGWKICCCLAFSVGASIAQGAEPDLQGLWDFGTATPFERPAALGEQRAYTSEEASQFEHKARERNLGKDAPVDLSQGAPAVGDKIGNEADDMSIDRRSDLTRVNGEYRTSIVVDPPDGRIPRRKEFADHFAQLTARNIQSRDGPEAQQAPTRCLSPLPVPSIYPMPWSALLQIVQTRDHVVLHSEMIHDARIVRLNGKHAAGDRKLWMGDSVGHFEGSTLVIHTVNFRPEQSYAAIMPMSEDFELTERFTRVSEDELLYSFTVVDPQAYTRPFSGERILKRVTGDTRMFEFACHEGNYSMTGILGGARKQEQDATGSPSTEPPSTGR